MNTGKNDNSFIFSIISETDPIYMDMSGGCTPPYHIGQAICGSLMIFLSIQCPFIIIIIVIYNSSIPTT